MSCFEKIFTEIEWKKSKITDEYIENEKIKEYLRNSEIVVFFITKAFVKDKQRREHCDIACNENKVMYAAVKKGTRWNKFKKYPWRKIEYFETGDDLKKIMKIFYKDYKWIKTSGGA